MEDIADILQQELTLVGSIKEKALAQQKALTVTRGGAAAGQLAEQLMQEMVKLSDIENKKEAILKDKDCKTISELLQKQPMSDKRQQAEQNLQDLQMVLTELDRIAAVSKKVLTKDMEFAGFTINVLNQVAADVTYAPEGASAAEPLRGKKMFDQSV